MFTTRTKLINCPTRRLSLRLAKIAVSGLLAASLAASMGTVPANAAPGESTAPPTAVSVPSTSTPAVAPKGELTTAPAREPLPQTAQSQSAATATSPSTSAKTMAPTSGPSAEAGASVQPAQTLAEQMGELGATMGQGAKKMAMNVDPQAAVPAKRSMVAAPYAQSLSATFRPAGVQGLDVSGWQTSDAAHSVSSVNWSRQWALGARFVYAKVSEGNNFADASFSSQYTGASNAGMLRGGYHFALPGQSSAVSQADYFVNHGGGWTGDGKTLPPLLDIEYNPYSSLGNTCYNFSTGAMVTWIKDFSNRVLARTGRLPMIYTTTDWWSQCTGNSSAFSNQPLHIAAYSTVLGALPNSWSVQSVWQYSSSGPFDGDSNAWNGTEASLKTFATKASAQVSKPPVVPPSNSPSIPSPADLVAADSSGALWRYPANGSGAVGSRKQIGQGWTGMRSITVIDWNSDGVFDVAAQRSSGELSLYKGLASGGFAAPQVLGSSGWADYQLTIGYWLSGSKYPQILGRSSGGALMLWKNLSGGTLQPATQIGSGWAGHNLTMIDFDGDGRQDILAQNSAGVLSLYRSNGAGTFISEARAAVGVGWAGMTSVSVSTGFRSASDVGLMARSSNGALSYYPVPGNSTFGAPSLVGSGWNPLLIAGGENINNVVSPPAVPVRPVSDPSIKATSDVVAADAAGTLWRYPVVGANLGSRSQIGSGFSSAVSIHVVDWNADGIQDLLIQWKSGKLSLYPGFSAGGFGSPITLADSGWSTFDITAGSWIRGSKYPSIVTRQPDGTLTSYTTTNGTTLTTGSTVATGMTRMHPIMTDFDGDGNADISAIDNIGRLILYRSNGYGQLISEARPVIGNGWNGMASVGAANAFTSAGSTGLLARTATGTLLYYPTSKSAFGAPSTLGTGWAPNLVAGSLRFAPQQPVISLSDVVTADTNGTLWNSAAPGNGTLQAPYAIGTGWTAAKTVRVVDWNSDGIPDVLTQRTNGTVTLDLGQANGGFQQRRTIGFSDWSNIRFVAGKWTKADQYPGLVGITPSGTLIHWANKSGTLLSTGVQIGQGWGGLNIALADFDVDGALDILATTQTGALVLYRSNGSGQFTSEPRKQIGNSWRGFSLVQGVNGYAGRNTQGVLAFQSSGDVRYYPINAGTGWGAPYLLDQKIRGKQY